MVDRETFNRLQKIPRVVSKVCPAKVSAMAASGESVLFDTSATLHFKIAHLSWNFKFYVSDSLPVPIIIGSDFLTHSKAIINMANHTLAFPYGTPRVFSLLPVLPTISDTRGSVTMGDNLTDTQKEQIQNLIGKFPNTITKQLGRTNLVEYKIRVNSDKIIRSRPYQYAPPKMELMRQHIADLLQKGVIRQSSSQFASPAFLVPKKGGKTRMVVDYRGLNSILCLDNQPMPTLESAFQHLSSAKWFTVLDLNQAYNQIPLAEESKQYTAFVTPWAQFEFNMLPFGIASGSLVLTSLIDKVFGDLKFKSVYNFFDDIAVYSSGSFEDHLQKLEVVLARLESAGLTVNPEKITVAADRIQFLGHTFSNQSISIHPERSRPIDQYPVPKTLKQLMRFLGMTAFYARFIKDYAQISLPLNHLKRKGVKFVWGPEQQEAFDALKAALTSHQVLKMPIFFQKIRFAH